MIAFSRETSFPPSTTHAIRRKLGTAMAVIIPSRSPKAGIDTENLLEVRKEVAPGSDRLQRMDGGMSTSKRGLPLWRRRNQDGKIRWRPITTCCFRNTHIFHLISSPLAGCWLNSDSPPLWKLMSNKRRVLVLVMFWPRQDPFHHAGPVVIGWQRPRNCHVTWSAWKVRLSFSRRLLPRLEPCSISTRVATCGSCNFSQRCSWHCCCESFRSGCRQNPQGTLRTYNVTTFGLTKCLSSLAS